MWWLGCGCRTLLRCVTCISVPFWGTWCRHKHFLRWAVEWLGSLNSLLHSLSIFCFRTIFITSDDASHSFFPELTELVTSISEISSKMILQVCVWPGEPQEGFLTILLWTLHKLNQKLWSWRHQQGYGRLTWVTVTLHFKRQLLSALCICNL